LPDICNQATAALDGGEISSDGDNVCGGPVWSDKRLGLIDVWLRFFRITGSDLGQLFYANILRERIFAIACYPTIWTQHSDEPLVACWRGRVSAASDFWQRCRKTPGVRKNKGDGYRSVSGQLRS
jgi:hypothetical protein